MKGIQDFCLTLLCIFTVAIGLSIAGCSDQKIKACESVNILLSGEMMIVYIIILIRFFLALWGDKRNK